MAEADWSKDGCALSFFACVDVCHFVPGSLTCHYQHWLWRFYNSVSGRPPAGRPTATPATTATATATAAAGWRKRAHLAF